MTRKLLLGFAFLGLIACVCGCASTDRRAADQGRTQTIGELLLPPSQRRKVTPELKQPLQPSETQLVGKWIGKEPKAVPDEVCCRIEWLAAHTLKKVAVSKDWGEWEALFLDPSDDRYWEKTYPTGGPPLLQCLSAEHAKLKYGVDVSKK